jgi:hypothetical protein
MSLAALEALIAGVKVRCEVVERDRQGRLVAKVFSPNGVDIGRRLVSAEWAVAYRRYSRDYVAAEKRGQEGQARDVAGHLCQTLGLARIIPAAAHAGNRFGYKRRQGARPLKPQEWVISVALEDGGAAGPSRPWRYALLAQWFARDRSRPNVNALGLASTMVSAASP